MFPKISSEPKIIYACVLLCAFTVPFAYTVKAQQYFTDHEANEESDGEVISIEHSIHKRSVPELFLYIKKHNYDRKFILQSSEGFFAGKKTKVWVAKKIGEEFRYVLKKDIMEKVNLTFYHNRKTRSVIAHTVNEEGVSEFNGIIDSDKVIRSLNNVKRFRRDVSSKSLYESKNNSFKNYHVLYKREISPPNSRKNNYSPNPAHDYDDLKIINETPEIVYPEILIYVDTSFFLHFNSSIEKTITYVLIFWNTVALYFREMDDPSVRLSIAGIVVCEDPIEPMNTYNINGRTLLRFSNFMFNQTNFNLSLDYDIAVFFVKPRIFQKVIGISYEGTVCRKIEPNVYSVSIISDSGNFHRISTGVHEIGHILGAPHDDNKNLSAAEIERCTFKNGFVMSYHRVNENQFYFSPCSKAKMKFTLSLERTECVRNNPAVGRTDDEMLSTFSGQYMSADEQCISGKYERALVSPRICVELECVKNNSRVYQNKPALEGTPCDVESACLMGKCVKVQSDRNGRNSVLDVLFPQHFEPYKSNKSLEEQCNERGILNVEKATLSDCSLNCQGITSTGYFENTFYKPNDGTVCNNNGYCLDGTCYDENYKLSEMQCINSGASRFSKKSSRECHLVCIKKLYKYSDVFRGPFFFKNLTTVTAVAQDGFPCNNNGYCKNGKCVNTTITSTTVSTNETTTPSDKYKSPIERCKDISMAWMYDFNDGCITYCENEENKEIDENLVAENGYPCDNNGTCEDGNCMNMTIVPSTTPSDKWHGFKSPSERCNIIGMSLADNYNEGCIAYCINETNKLDDHLVAENGYPCDNNGICDDGICINMSFMTSTIRSTTPTERSYDGFESPLNRCLKIQMFLSYNHDTTNCTIVCTSKNALSIKDIFKIDEKIVFQNLTAEDGYPCETDGFCLKGKCMDIKISEDVNREFINWNNDELRGKYFK
ncbi:disintegrin and metalloproteinase domain-containing protein 7-like [Leptopilina heterotoma]|uniref:disintegrin and metalloproteinase domain-containing protein 7-like n=1 Tax=Leptopilina heterotoma TaxID=63436 RepID=UPI001CA9636B|nr:disintegrin and metalloproteinase domain-containing protein 7-like [Leptopilina heterotoma]